MVAIDTNILVRLLIDDPEAVQQTLLARQFLKTVRQVYVPQIVQVECVWVLERAYKVPKEQLLSLLTTLYDSRVFVLQSEASFLSALQLFRDTNVGFADSLILSEVQSEKLNLFTFDKKLGHLKNCQLLTETSPLQPSET